MLAKTLKDTFNAVNPVIPLESDDVRYVDCTAVRGNEDVVEQLFNTIEWSNDPTSKTPYTTQLFTGHRGCGKSTELRRLTKRLLTAEYAVIYLEADDLIDVEDTTYTDVLLALANQIFNDLKAMAIYLPEDVLKDIYLWFAEIVEEKEIGDSASISLQSEIGAGTPSFLSGLASVLVKLTGQIRTSVDTKKNIRRKLDPQVTQLIEKINRLILYGTAALRTQGKRGLVVIVDNLDRVPPHNADGKNQHDALYIDHGEQLCLLNCHLIYTVPIAMYYSPRARLMTSIFTDNQVVPMIKLRLKDATSDEYWQPGLDTLYQILRKRVDLEEMFESSALDLLIKMSGGVPRILMQLVRYACQYAANRSPKPIDLNAAQRSVNRLVNEYERSIPETHFPLLAQVYRSKKADNDENHLQMMHNLSVLEYMNGRRWQDVQPMVLQLEKFKAAYGAERA